eukprot:5946416-Amphidinium_carterae.1
MGTSQAPGPGEKCSFCSHNAAIVSCAGSNVAVVVKNHALRVSASKTNKRCLAQQAYANAALSVAICGPAMCMKASLHCCCRLPYV